MGIGHAYAATFRTVTYAHIQLNSLWDTTATVFQLAFSAHDHVQVAKTAELFHMMLLMLIDALVHLKLFIDVAQHLACMCSHCAMAQCMCSLHCLCNAHAQHCLHVSAANNIIIIQIEIECSVMMSYDQRFCCTCVKAPNIWQHVCRLVGKEDTTLTKYTFTPWMPFPSL